jgi:hypothetical protein
VVIVTTPDAFDCGHKSAIPLRDSLEKLRVERRTVCDAPLRRLPFGRAKAQIRKTQ